MFRSADRCLVAAQVLPMVEPNDVVVGGWDICATPLGDAMKKSKVLDVDLQRQLVAAASDRL